jgi:glutamine transport system permease protein
MPVNQLWKTITIFLLITILVSACTVSNSPSTQSGEKTPVPQAKIRIGVDASLQGFEMPGPDANEYNGLDIEIMNEIAKQKNLNIEYVNSGYDQALGLVAQCRLAAAISAIAITDLLKDQVNLSDPYFTTSNVLVVKKGNLVITDLNSLQGMTVGMLIGTPLDEKIKNLPGVQISVYTTYFLAFQDLITGAIDAIVADKPHALTYVEKKANNLKVVGEEFGTVKFGVAVCKTQPGLLSIINQGIADLTENNKLNRFIKKWIPKNRY